MTYVAGGYSSTYNSLDLGVTQRGFELEWSTFEEPVIGDNMGDTPQDGVYTGASAFVNVVLQEYNASAASSAFWPWSASFGTLGLVGRMKWDLSHSLVLTAVSGTRAASIGPSTVTFPAAVLAANFPVRMLFGPTLRNVPLRMQAFPYYAGAPTTPVGSYYDGYADNAHLFEVA